MKYEIIGTYEGNEEVLDTTESIKDAIYLKLEYQIAYGSDWMVKARKKIEKGDGLRRQS